MTITVDDVRRRGRGVLRRCGGHAHASLGHAVGDGRGRRLPEVREPAVHGLVQGSGRRKPPPAAPNPKSGSGGSLPCRPAIALLLEIEKTVAEGAGAVPPAALLEHRDRFAGKKVGLVLIGGNIDVRILASVLMRAMVRTDRISTLRLEVRDLPRSDLRSRHQRRRGDRNA